MNKLHHMTWEEVQQYVADGNTAAILPVGATEQHGPQLGCGTDTEIALQLCESVAEKTGVLLLPTLPYGCSIGHSQRWPGTLALQPKTLIDVIKDIGDWTWAAGITRLFIVNAHVTNYAPLRCALEMLRAEHDGMMVALINTPSISSEVEQAHCHDGDDWHANDAETGLMWALNPAMVRTNKIEQSDDPDRTQDCVFSHPVNRTSTNGVTGSPSLASEEKGKALFSRMVDGLTTLIEAGLKEESPLSHSYFKNKKA